jgi:hypothetical protein
MATIETTGEKSARGSRGWLVLAALIFLFAVSVLIRLPNLNRPLSTNHEWITAHTLIVLNLWHESGMAKFFYSPCITWQNPGDKGIGWEGYLLLHDKEDNYYHASYPPLGYYAPYAVFNLLGVAPNPLSLELFNLALCGISAAFIFLTVKKLYRAEPGMATLAAVWAFAGYLFNPGTLWFQCNTYFVDMLMQPLFILAIFCGATLLEKEFVVQKKWWWFTAVVLALTAFTEWIALFCYVTLAGLFVLQKNWRPHWRGLLLLGLCVAGAFAMVPLILARITGLPEAVHFILAKYLQKSGLGHQSNAYDTLKALYHFGWSYLHYFGGLFLLLAALALLWLKTRPARPFFSRAESNLLILSAAPVLLHHAALFGFTLGNDYSTIKAAPFFCFLSAMLFKRLWQHGFEKMRAVLVTLGFAAMIFSTVLYFDLFNPNVKNSALRDLGQSMAKTAGPDDVVCLVTPETVVEPQISFYARRSILFYKSEALVLEHLKHYGLSRAVIFRVDGNNVIQHVRWLSADPAK